MQNSRPQPVIEIACKTPFHLCRQGFFSVRIIHFRYTESG